MNYSQCGFTEITFKLCETQLVCTLSTKHEKVYIIYIMRKYLNYMHTCVATKDSTRASCHELG